MRAAGGQPSPPTQWLLAEEDPPDAAAPAGQGGSDGGGGGGGGGGRPGAPHQLGSGSDGGPLAALIDEGWAGGQPPLPGHGCAIKRHQSVTAGLGTQAARLVGDEYKESHRKEMRTIFSFLRWKAHRSSKRYLRHMLGTSVPQWEEFSSPAEAAAAFDLPSKLRSLTGPMLYVLTVATLVATYHAMAQAGKVPAFVPGFNIGNNAPFGLTSFALSLLLVFRTNASYSRWLDARKSWGNIVNRSRDIVRQGLTYFPPDQPQQHAMLCRWVIAFSRSMMCSLREEGDDEAELGHVLPAEELEALLAAAHRPNYALQVLSELVWRAQQGQPLAPAQEQQQQVYSVPPLMVLMDANLTAFEDDLGTCERILRTPIPLAYTRHTSRFMMIWLTLLPFTLWDSCRWAMLPMCAIIAFLLLGIEEIGVSIEEPFSILPLEHMCKTIERNVRELHSMHSRDAAAQQAGQQVAGAVSAVSLVAAGLRAAGSHGQ